MLVKKELKLDEKLYPKYATIYTDSQAHTQACLLYFHGGGLLYGQREDLPALHLDMLTRAGYAIVCYDYPLAPAAKLEKILADVCASINHYITFSEKYCTKNLPYFLWGRSAGAYLCLLAAAHGELSHAPSGIISYYGYGFLCDHWFQAPSAYYQTLPHVGENCLAQLGGEIYTKGSLDTHYSVYVYARQTGAWRSLIYEGRDKFFYLDYTLRTCTCLPCPLFCTHSTGDTDVPYEEFIALCDKFHPQQLIVPSSEHDFDRDESSPFTQQLLGATLEFLDNTLTARK